ncbi:MAG: pseudoazurin [Pseudomonadota bacterium]
MTQLVRRRQFLAATAASTLFMSLGAQRQAWAATTHTVEMLNKHPENDRLRQVFFPRIITIEAGDTVSFVSVDKGHNSAIIDGMIPDGEEGWSGRISKDVSAEITKPGFYGYQCTPHASVGMVGLVIVKGDGMMDNLVAAQEVRQRGKAKKVWEEIWAEVEGMDLTA